MRGGFGPRFVVEAIFLVVVAAVAGLAEFPTAAIVLVMALAWLLVAGVEWALARPELFASSFRRRRESTIESAAPVQHVWVPPRDPEPSAQPVIERRQEPMPEPDLDAPPAPEPAPPVLEPALAEPTPAADMPAIESRPKVSRRRRGRASDRSRKAAAAEQRSDQPSEPADVPAEAAEAPSASDEEVAAPKVSRSRRLGRAPDRGREAAAAEQRSDEPSQPAEVPAAAADAPPASDEEGSARKVSRSRRRGRAPNRGREAAAAEQRSDEPSEPAEVPVAAAQAPPASGEEVAAEEREEGVAPDRGAEEEPEPVAAAAERSEPVASRATELPEVPDVPEVLEVLEVPEHAAEPARDDTVVAFPRTQAPREWNLWELDRLARDRAGQDAARDEERSYLLMYLREYASPEGTLPINFDLLVRESFGELIEQ